MLFGAIDFKEFHGRALAAEGTKMNITTEAQEIGLLDFHTLP